MDKILNIIPCPWLSFTGSVEDAAINVYHYLSHGGIVMVPLILCSCIMWTLIIDRVFFFSRLEKKDLKLSQLLKGIELISLSDPDCQKEIRNKKNIQSSGGPGHKGHGDGYCGIRAFLVTEIFRRRTHDRTKDLGIIDECIIPVAARLDRYLSAISVLAAVSPLFGLLGTVTGMISTFDVITLFGTGNARAMAGGISEALVTTQSGLLVSIPGLFMSVFLYRKSSLAKTRLKAAVLILKRSLK